MAISKDPLNLIICGVGGQGNVLISSIIASALNKKNYYVTVGDTFGAAQRGGAVFSSLRISPNKYYGPLIPEGTAHLILGLEPLETLRLLVKYGNPEIVCITNTYAVYPVGVMANQLEYPDSEELEDKIRGLSKSAWFLNATEMALEMGAQIAMNVVMAGALIGSNQLPLEKKDVEEVLRETFSPERMELNLKALEMGFNAIRSQN